MTPLPPDDPRVSIHCSACDDTFEFILPPDIFSGADQGDGDVPVLGIHGGEQHAILFYIDREHRVTRSRVTALVTDAVRGVKGMTEVYTHCKLCGESVFTPVPRQYVTTHELPIVPIAFVHGSPSHALVVFLDHDLRVRRQRFVALFAEVGRRI
ncbi:MAG: hypothetical protein ACTSU5_07410 [Promethearchaeota archaeon]